MEKWSNHLDFKAIGRIFGSPLYVFNPDQLISNFNDYLLFASSASNIRYPIKTNPSLEIVRYIRNLGGGADCSNDVEVTIATIAGIPMNRIIYNTPAPKINYAINLLYEGADIVVDSLQFLKKLEKNIEKRKMKGKIFLRIFPSSFKLPVSDSKEKKLPNNDMKFGIEEENILNYLKNPKILISGLHFHPGLKLFSVEDFIKEMEFLNSFADIINDLCKGNIYDLDIGGGLGIKFLPEDRSPSIHNIMTSINQYKRREYNYLIEPGLSLVGNTMGILFQINTIKSRQDRIWAIADVGHDQLIPNRPYHVLDQNHKSLSQKGKDKLVGPLCFSGDIILNETTLNHLSAGDFLFAQHVGAYNYSVSNHFNGRQYGGMIKITNSEITQCNVPENFYLNSLFTTYLWQSNVKIK